MSTGQCRHLRFCCARTSGLPRIVLSDCADSVPFVCLLLLLLLRSCAHCRLLAVAGADAVLPNAGDARHLGDFAFCFALCLCFCRRHFLDLLCDGVM